MNDMESFVGAFAFWKSWQIPRDSKGKIHAQEFCPFVSTTLVKEFTLFHSLMV